MVLGIRKKNKKNVLGMDCQWDTYKYCVLDDFQMLGIFMDFIEYSPQSEQEWLKRNLDLTVEKIFKTAHRTFASIYRMCSLQTGIRYQNHSITCELSNRIILLNIPLY